MRIIIVIKMDVKMVFKQQPELTTALVQKDCPMYWCRVYIPKTHISMADYTLLFLDIHNQQH